MGYSDHLRCSVCGACADDGCADDCPRLAREAQQLREAGFDPDDHCGPTLAMRIDEARMHLESSPPRRSRRMTAR